jgi:hypothetical protein
MTTPVPVHRDPASGLTAGSSAEVRHGLVSRLSAEAFGTLFIVVAGLGVPLFTIPQSSPLPAALAAGLAVTAAMLAFGYVSGGHFNPAVTVGHAVAGRIRQFREDTRGRRIDIARELESATDQKVAWGVVCAGERELFTTLAAPVMTRLRQSERQVLDTLVEAGVARSRSEAVAWCVRLVSEHTDSWLEELNTAMAGVRTVREAGPNLG